ncbi:short-chain dehydrogenase [Lutibacter sp.]|uniref:YqaA family protein n=1 Tax=Lutibacter sp. TaxID=1925666 RepID=UPI0025C3EF29|nr:short-chain dehydrogenase [Lutibacter sp.]MCF6168769.1 short-chain dehydrogenase [Lutibacter sp.]
MKRTTKVQKKSKFKLLHQYYSYTGFYTFIGKNLKKAILPFSIIVIGLLLFNKFIFNINEGLHSLTEMFSTLGVLTLFFISESLLGLIPPEIFIAWTKKTTEPILNLVFLATLSYIGGIISYFIGKAVLRIKSVKNYLEIKMAKQLKNTAKWGGFLIVVGALLPVPFSMTCLAGGMIKYPLKGVLLFGLLRFVRFAIYGAAIFQVVS